MGDSKSSFHPALAVSNIKNLVPITLEMENVQYATWAELFKIHARSHKVLDHIIPPASGKEKMPKTDEEKELWSTLDATVLQWIYATISHDLLHTILEPDTTAMEAWNRLRDIFQDNKHSRAVTLEYDFTHTQMENFPNVSAYCQHLKSLSDQLKSVGSPVDNSRLVLQLVSGLTESYKGVATLIRQSDPLPQFYQARSMLVLEEAGLKKATQTTDSAMVAHDLDDSHENVDQHSNHRNNYGGKRHQHRNNSGKQRSSSGGRGGGKGSSGNSSSGGGKGGSTNRWNGGQQQPQNQWLSSQQWPWPWMQWAVPPCPFPAGPWARPHFRQGQHQQPGILGPRPQQPYSATGPTPTDIEAVMHTLGITPPDPNWYMDTGATSHMTSG
ncbi:uncharacterized protein LOC132612030 [Lycium barbarum]|uniref:uncharacterized protein LOC132612030 n=1 Tax=Lycium barbarum TaxID=112863 RepID=UPI00293F0480|nr:uncharacterized protein LOC132612030 [Lycium barbarum]